MDIINIKKLRIYARHGVYPGEKRHSQLFMVTAALHAELRAAGLSDDLGLTVDYSAVCGAIKSYVESNSFNLLETVAEGLAEMLLKENPAVKRVRIEIEKPDAPLPLDLDTVSVEIERARHIAYIGLGSNLGDRRANIDFAVSKLEKAAGCAVLQVSQLIDTAPYGYVEQGDFLNGCLELETLLEPLELLDLLMQIENDAGRVRDLRWGPRTLDLDIILYDDLVASAERLRIPHAEMHKRSFVLAPLCEIAPSILHPVLNKTAAELLQGLNKEN